MKKQLDESTKSKIGTPINAEQALQFIQAFVVRKIGLTESLYEPNARVLGRIEAYKDVLNAVDGFMKRTKIKSIGRADRSHVKILSENLP